VLGQAWDRKHARDRAERDDQVVVLERFLAAVGRDEVEPARRRVGAGDTA
jgi:hypothetical protein